VKQEPVGKVMFVAHRKAPDVDWAAGVEIRDGAKLYTTPPSVEAAIEATKEKAAKLIDSLYKHDRKESGYDEGWNDALDIAEQAIRSMK
jgi:hypothetical protein